MIGEVISDYPEVGPLLKQAGRVMLRTSVSAAALLGVQTMAPAVAYGQEPIGNETIQCSPGDKVVGTGDNASCEADISFNNAVSPETPINSDPLTPPNIGSPEKRHYSLNMHEYNRILSSRGCGILALSTAISYQRQKETSPYMIWDRVDNVFTKSGAITKNQYMRFAAPQAARHYDLKSHQTSLDNAISNIEQGGAVIMLATADPGHIITGASHYFEADEAKNGKLHIHDPNQKPGRSFNNSWRSIQWLKAHNTLSNIWVIEPK
jgi:hypothetical protein